jgi:DNA-binding transcriptional ArsR family regulator
MSPNEGEPRQPGPVPGMREVTDARTLRALAHPIRIALIEALSVYGPMTATEVGERISESATTCSFHLRQLAKYDFVEEAGGGKGRARPWRMTSIGLSFSNTSADAEAVIAARALERLVRERQLERFATWQATSMGYPVEWQRAATSSEFVTYLTADELRALVNELAQLLMSRYVDRLTDPSLRPPGSVPVETLLFAYPTELPPPADGADSAGE